jgi:branched-chain amino acid transport system ATP-binding protein
VAAVSEPLLRVRGLTKAFGAVRANDDLDLEVRADEVHAVIGPNGAGKTTLMAQLAGEIAPDDGLILFDGEDLAGLPAPTRAERGIARSFQITSVFPEFTVLMNVGVALLARRGHAFRFWRPVADDRALLEGAAALLQRCGLTGRESQSAGMLSHGERRQLELAMALAPGPRLMLLDEPMAGMGTDETRLMVELLRGLKGTVTMVLVEHDMDTVFALADRISVLVEGRCIATGEPEAIRADPEVRCAYLGEEDTA